MTPHVRTKRHIAKVEKLIDDENPPTQDRMAKDLGVSRGTVQNIKFNIYGKIVKKRKVHALTVKQAEQRCEPGKKFLQFLSRRKLPFLFTMDEIMVPSQEVTGQTNFYYKR